MSKLREEEDTFRRRLLYDGHGTGEDKRLVSLMKNISKFCLSEDPNDDPTKLYNIISKELTAAIHIAERNEKASEMYDKTHENLNKRIVEEADYMTKIKTDLGNLELELKYVEKLKKVNEYPNSVETEKTMKDIERRKGEMCLRLEKLGNDLKVLTESCKNLKKIFDDNDTEFIKFTDSGT